jgi:hypothetical protein
MKEFKIILIVVLTLVFGAVEAQVGIGTIVPDESSILDLNSDTKGFLPPRLSQLQRDNINSPASGLVVFNTTTNDLETNTGTPTTPNWKGTKGGYETINATENCTTISTVAETACGMMLTPVSGTYSVTFNSQFNNAQYTTTIPQIVLDLESLYKELKEMPVTNPAHGLVFGNATVSGEILIPGVYSITGATSVTTNLTFDAQGNSDALFVIRVDGAFTSTAGATIMLANGALAKNVFWVIRDAISFASGSIMKGVAISYGSAIACETGVNLEGRLFTTAGAISYGPGTAVIPLGTSQINLGVLAPYIIFSSNGAVSNAGTSSYKGDIGTVNGLLSGYESLTTVDGNLYGPSSFPTPGIVLDNNKKMLATFGIYQNDVLISGSTKSLISTANASNISLQAVVNVTAGQPIEVKWNTGLDKLTMGNRTLTVIKIQ